MKKLVFLICILTSIQSLGQAPFEEQLDILSQTISQKLSEKNIKKIAVSEFVELSGDSSLLGKYISDEFGIGLTIHSTTFEVVERSRLDVLLKEQKLSSASLFNDSTRIQLGNIYGVEALLFGTITTFENDMRLTMRVINTETGALINAQAVNISYNERVKMLLGKSNKAKPLVASESPKTAQKVVEPVQIDNRPKCEKQMLGDLIISNKNWCGTKVAPINNSTDANTVFVPAYQDRTYYELPAGVQKLQVKFVDRLNSTIKTEVIQVNIQQCKTVTFTIQ